MEVEKKLTRKQLYNEMKDNPVYKGAGAMSRMKKEELLALREKAGAGRLQQNLVPQSIIKTLPAPTRVGEGRKKKALKFKEAELLIK